ncbi:hypothetical protein NL676_032059 [Syzygium grande]|nr:hypothetical protein NL676_032059 [Syzygium grande]
MATGASLARIAARDGPGPSRLGPVGDRGPARISEGVGITSQRHRPAVASDLAASPHAARPSGQDPSSQKRGRRSADGK